MDQALIIFIKNPEKGKVKTRLAQTMGDDQALDVYLKLLAKTRSAAEEVSSEKYVFYSSYMDKADLWSNDQFVKKVQHQTSDLGERMSDACNQLAQKHQKLVIVGSDCPLISKSILKMAFTELDNHDLVVGPALDGGYYLLGMNGFYPQVFQDIDWSSERVFRQTIYQALKINLNYSVLQTLPDIDFERDWEKYGW